jgi:tRNA 2-thiouridine synthesizing protein C
MKKYLLIMQHSPYQSSLAAEALEFALALSAFNQSVALLFVDQGILQLLPNQDAAQISAKNFTKVYEGLSLFDIRDVYVSQASLPQYQLPDLMIQPQVVDDLKIAELIAAHDIVLTL